MEFFKTVFDGIEDEYTLASDEKSAAEFAGFVDTGSFIFNGLLSGKLVDGGMPNNKVTAIAGESTTGKTYFALGIIANFQRQNKDALVIYFDTEAAVTSKMMKDRGVDTTRVALPVVDTIEQFKTKTLKIVANYEKVPEKERMPMMIVLDSLSQLPSNKELNDAMEGKDIRDMTKTQVIRSTFRTIGQKLARVKIPLILTSHTYEVVGAYVPTKEISGGGGVKYAASTIIFLKKKKDRDGKDVIGNIITCTTTKSRFTKEAQSVDVKLSYSTGLDRYYGLLELAEEAEIWPKMGTRYDVDGTKLYGKTILSDPEKYFTPEVMAQLEVAAEKKFTYGVETEDEVIEDVLEEEQSTE